MAPIALHRPATASLALGHAALLLAQAAIALWLGLPGHLSTDSIIQLYEGRTLQRLSFNPPLMSMLLGAFDRLGNAPIAFVLLSQVLLTAASWLVLQESRRGGQRGGWRLALAALCLLNPVVLIHVGIVWKDVLLGHAVVLLYLLIARAWRRRTRVGWAWSAAIALLLTIVLGARQQGALFALPAAVWAAAALVRARLPLPIQSPARAAIARLAPPFAAALLVFALLPLAANRIVASLPQQATPQAVDSASVGWRVLAQFDLVGILAHGGRLPAAALPPPVADSLQAEVARYTPYRVDTLRTDNRYWLVPPAQVARVWFDAIRLNPLAYAQHRFAHFFTLLGLADRQSCVPIHSGVGGPVVIDGAPADLVELLGLRTGPYRNSDEVQDIAHATLDTPLYMHAFYAIVIAMLTVLLAKRREFVLATLAACSLAFLGSYYLIGIACDFRYAYTLTVATSLLAAQWLLTAPGPTGARPADAARQASDTLPLGGQTGAAQHGQPT
ncbi:MAG: hypothetical protein J0H09_06110 [Burkholderiales bacterium]|nr:hypothetical protein [Burkholderiales bacterium]